MFIRRLAPIIHQQGFAPLVSASAAIGTACITTGYVKQREAFAQELKGGGLKVVLCANGISGQQAYEAMHRNERKPDCVVVPMMDDGMSTLNLLVEGCGGFFVTGVTVQDPLQRPAKTIYGMIDDVQGKTAVIEVARASGLKMLQDLERDPLATTTVGTGQLIKHALDLGAKRVIICNGGTATNDGGVGAAYALGYRFFDKEGIEVDPIGGRLLDIAKIDITNVDERLRNAEIIVACDVTNPLCGRSGATQVYGPQKGARTEESRKILDQGLAHLAQLWSTQLSSTPKDLALQPGSGASGGLAGGAVAFFGAKLWRLLVLGDAPILAPH